MNTSEKFKSAVSWFYRTMPTVSVMHVLLLVLTYFNKTPVLNFLGITHADTFFILEIVEAVQLLYTIVIYLIGFYY